MHIGCIIMCYLHIDFTILYYIISCHIILYHSVSYHVLLYYIKNVLTIYYIIYRMLLQIFQNIRAYTLCLAPILPGIADLEVLRKAGNQIPGDKHVWCAAPATCIRGAWLVARHHKSEIHSSQKSIEIVFFNPVELLPSEAGHRRPLGLPWCKSRQRGLPVDTNLHRSLQLSGAHQSILRENFPNTLDPCGRRPEIDGGMTVVIYYLNVYTSVFKEVTRRVSQINKPWGYRKVPGGL